MTTEERFLTGAIFAVLWLWLIWQDRRVDRIERRLKDIERDSVLYKSIDQEYSDTNWRDF